MANQRDAWTEWAKAKAQTIAPQERRSKYGAVKVTVDGITFHSKREAARYHELKLMEKAGEIRGLRLQPAFDLMVVSAQIRTYKVGEYIADFQYEARLPIPGPDGVVDHWTCIIEDVKGFKTPLYRWKKKHVEAQYGIKIREI